jgi:hypothetical protein
MGHDAGILRFISSDVGGSFYFYNKILHDLIVAVKMQFPLYSSTLILCDQ